MGTLIVISIILLITTWFVQGLNFATIMAIVSTTMFCCRKFGYFCKPNSLVVMESVSLFITVVMQLLFKRFNILTFIIIVIMRALFLWIVYYDTEAFVYVSKEVRRE